MKKLTDLGFETLTHPPYSPDRSPTEYDFFKYVDIFLRQKIFRSKREIEIAFKYYLVSKPLAFYHKGIHNIVNRV